MRPSVPLASRLRRFASHLYLKRMSPEKKSPAQTKTASAKASASEEPHIVQEHPDDAPVGWPAFQEKLAASTGLSLLLVDGRQPPALVASNNNSICHAFQSSLEYVRLCDPYCGDAHRRALSAGSAVQYKCHAGLQCFTTPVQIGGEQNLAAIGGRAFVSASDYRNLVDRFRAGELNDLLASKPFDNVIFAEEERLEQLQQKLQKAVRSYDSRADTLIDQVAADLNRSSDQNEVSGEPVRVDERPSVSKRPEAAKSDETDLRHEVDRLMFELEHRDRLDALLQRFADHIRSQDPDTTYRTILADVQELLKAERASLMIFDEATSELSVKASTGLACPEDEVGAIRLGEGIAGKVLESGESRVIEDLEAEGLKAAPADRLYKTGSFISFPITLKGRRLGVLNVADKVAGGRFQAIDLGMLEVLSAPIADALDRARLQQLSTSDPLTGLLNRRYLKERLTEELNRSKRYKHPMSCLVIDIDDFKYFNDRNGHLAGDEALRLTARCLKGALRAVDVACRYGGEEFCVLLPQTTLAEAGVIGERMRQLVTQIEHPLGKLQPLGSLSVSVGISTFTGSIDTADKIIEAADRALYRAKLQGKNRIAFFLEDSVS